jgi:hypothetical protein
MVASGSRTMIAGSLSSCIAGFHQSCRFSQSSGRRRSCAGIGPAFGATGVGNASTWRAATNGDGSARANPADARRKSALGSTLIHCELLKRGFEVAQSSVAKYMIKRRGHPTRDGERFLRKPRARRCRHGYVCYPDHWLGPALCLHHRAARSSGPRLDRRHNQVDTEWVARQITEAFPWDGAPRYLIRDRDRIYGTVTRRLRAMGILDKPIAPASPWQNGFVERLIGSIRRQCADHIVVLGEAHLRRILKSYARYYSETRTHLALDKDAPASRPVQRTGVVRSLAVLGGLHHHYARA